MNSGFELSPISFVQVLQDDAKAKNDACMKITDKDQCSQNKDCAYCDDETICISKNYQQTKGCGACEYYDGKEAECTGNCNYDKTTDKCSCNVEEAKKKKKCSELTGASCCNSKRGCKFKNGKCGKDYTVWYILGAIVIVFGLISAFSYKKRK